MHSADYDLFPELRHLQFDLKHSADVGYMRRLVDFFATDKNQQYKEQQNFS